jgi:hypothetical protein
MHFSRLYAHVLGPPPPPPPPPPPFVHYLFRSLSLSPERARKKVIEQEMTLEMVCVNHRAFNRCTHLSTQVPGTRTTHVPGTRTLTRTRVNGRYIQKEQPALGNHASCIHNPSHEQPRGTFRSSCSSLSLNFKNLPPLPPPPHGPLGCCIADDDDELGLGFR